MRKENQPTAGRESRPHIGIYGRCNAGKSTLLNFITQGDFALVAPQPGTTTDPVRKSYEILGFAPVVFIDTAGLDDPTELGEKRRSKTLETLPQIDLALLVFRRWGDPEEAIRDRFDRDGIPYLLIQNRYAGEEEEKSDIYNIPINLLQVGIPDRDRLLAEIRRILPERSYILPSMFEGKAGPDDIVLLVCPIDSEAPSGRLILPQVQAIRALLDTHAVPIVVQPEQIPAVFRQGLTPKLVVTDSQAFAEVRSAVPAGIEITSFSILLARQKGDYAAYSEGLQVIDRLRSGDRVLILENCLHQNSCEDIGRVKIPRLLQQHCGCDLAFTIVSGLAPLPADLERYALAVQCGGCMVTRSQLQNRIRAVRRAGVAITNYGMLLNALTQ